MKRIHSFLSAIAAAAFLLLSFPVGVIAAASATGIGGTGTTSPSGILYGDNAATTHLNTTSIGTGVSFSGGILSNTGLITASCPGGFLTCSGTNPVSFVLGTLGVPNGGTGSTTLSGILKGNGTSAVGTLVIGSGLTYDGTTLSASGGSGITAIGPTGQTQTGATITLASSTTGTDFTVTGAGNTLTFNLPTASASNRGLLSSADWSTFNGKQSALTFSTGLTNTAGTVTVNTSQNISTLSNLTSNGAVLTSGGTGALSIYTGTSCTNQFVRSLSGSVAATCATVANTDLANSTIALTDANSTLTIGGSPASLGGTLTATLNLSHANTFLALQQFNGQASSTQFSASSILYAARAIISGIAASFTPTIEGEFGFDTTDNQFKVFSGGATRVLSPNVDAALVIATSSLNSAATTTFMFAGFPHATTFKNFGCLAKGGGTFVWQLGNGSASTTSATSGTGTTVTQTTLSSNNAFSANAAIYLDVGTVSGTVTNPTCSYTRTIDPT